MFNGVAVTVKKVRRFQDQCGWQTTVKTLYKHNIRFAGLRHLQFGKEI